MVVSVFIMTADMYLAHRIKRVCIDVALWRIPEVGGRDENVVHIEQKTTPGAPDDFSQKSRFIPGAFLKRKVA